VTAIAARSLGERIRLARKERGMTQAELAADDYTRAYISMIERDRVRPSLQTLQVLASRLGKPVHYFVEGLPCSRGDVLLLCNLATGFIERRDFDKALTLLEQAAEYAARLGDGRLRGLVNMTFCRLYEILGRYDEAWEHGLDARQALTSHGDPDDLARTIIYLGNVERSRGNLVQAKRLYEEALEILRGSGNQRLLTMANWGLGNVTGELERIDEAYEHFQLALKCAEGSLGVKDRAALQMGLALTYRERGDLDRALELSAKALQVYEETGQAELVADLHNNIGSILARRGDRRAARRSYERSLEILGAETPVQAAEALRGLAGLDVEEGDPDSGVARARAALRIAKELEAELEEARCLVALARGLMGQGRAPDAVQHLRRAKTIFAERGLERSTKVAAELLRNAEGGSKS